MAAVVGKFAAKRMLNGQLKKYAHKEPAGQYVSCYTNSTPTNTPADHVPQDPYYEYRRDARGRKRKYKKQIPAYIPEHDAEILAAVRKRAYRLDMALFNFAGIRFGWSSVIGLIPELGDVVDLLMALSVYRQCKSVDGGLDSNTKMRMKMYILFDFVIGLVPILGDLLDASVKANSHNVRLLEIALDKKYKPEEIRKREERVKRESGANYQAPAPATVYEEMSDEDGELPRYESRRHSPEPRRPDPARTRDSPPRRDRSRRDRSPRTDRSPRRERSTKR